MKKMIFSLIFILLAAAGAQAAALDGSRYADGIYGVSGRSDRSHIPVKLEILQGGVSYRDLDSAELSDAGSLYLYVGHQYTDQDGKFSFSVPVTETGGNHLVRLTFLGQETLKTAFYTYPDSEVSAAAAEFLEDAQKTPEKLGALVTQYCGGLKVDFEDYGGLSAEEKSAMLDAAIEAADIPALKTALQRALAIALLSKTDGAGAAAVIGRYAGALGIADAVWFGVYDAFLDGEKAQICAFAPGSAVTAETVADTLENRVILRDLKRSLWNELGKKLRKYEKILAVSVASVEDLGGVSAQKVYAALKTDLDNDKFADISEISAALASYVKKYAKDGGSGGGSGGKGSSGGSIPPYAYSPAPEAQKEQVHILPFNDLDGAAWAKDAIVALFERGIVKGRADGLFCPGDGVTREEFVALVVRAFALPFSSRICTATIPPFNTALTQSNAARWGRYSGCRPL